MSQPVWQRNYWLDQEVFCCAEHQTGCSKKAEQTGYLFLQRLNLFQLFDFSCQPAPSCTEAPYQSRLGARPCSISGSLPKTLSVHHHTEQQLYINSYLLVPEEHKFIKTKCGMGESQGGEEQMNPNGAGQTFFFFQYQRKKRQSKRSFADESSSILHLDVCAQTLTRTHARTHADAITCTFNSDKRKEHDRDFSTTASLRMSFICLSRWRTPHKRIFLKEIK